MPAQVSTPNSTDVLTDVLDNPLLNFVKPALHLISSETLRCSASGGPPKPPNEFVLKFRWGFWVPLIPKTEGFQS